MRSPHATLLLAALAAALACAGGATAASVGVNDDSAKYADDGGAWFFAEAHGVGLRQVVVSNRFRPTDPDQIQEEAMLDQALAEAERQGVEVVLAVYPYPPREFELGGVDLEAFGSYLDRLARRYPQVRQYVIGNEPNQPAFWRPLFRPGGAVASAAQAGALLGWAYDALKNVDPTIRVVGVGLSPRGNDNPLAPSNASISPARFIEALGRWYRASGRTAPLMDGFSFHPYPNSATDTLERGYAWPNAGFVNLDRIKQAFGDAFQGTAQPTTVNGLTLHLDELGWQVDTSTNEAYTGAENVRVTNEARQAAIYAEVVRRAACDPTIAELNFFGLDDDRARDIGWQAGLYRADRSPRAAAGAVAAAIGEADRDGCMGDVTMWRPASRVVGAWAGAAGGAAAGTVSVRLAAREGAHALACVLTARSTTPPSQLARRMQQSGGGRAGCRAVALTPTRTLGVRLAAPAPSVPGARYVGIRFTAEANPVRSTTIVVRARR
jgi:hypothetical protein